MFPSARSVRPRRGTYLVRRARYVVGRARDGRYQPQDAPVSGVPQAGQTDAG